MKIEFFMIPGLLLTAAALVLPWLPRRWRSVLCVAAPALVFLVIARAADGAQLELSFLGFNLMPFHLDALSRVFGLIFCFVLGAAGLFAWNLRDRGQQTAAMLYGAASLGATFSGDYLSLFIFWEIMAVASTFLVWARRESISRRAGLRYLIIHLFGGGILFAGILLQFSASGDLLIAPLSASAAGTASWLILAGIGLNAAIPPLHAWLPDAYPKATITGAVFMSALTSKVAVYALARIFPGWTILIVLGTVMAVYGVIYAILADDMREILSYHIVCQVGYMVAAIGIGSEMALDGASAHAVNNILYKTLMFMAVGSVMHATGKSRLSQLGGLYGRMPLVFFLYLVGALSISGFPLFNGFVSKGMVIGAAAAAHLDWVAMLLLLASLGTFISVGLKLPYYCWLAGDEKSRPQDVPAVQPAGMLLLAIPCLVFGIAPMLLGNLLPFQVDPHAYTTGHVLESVQMLSAAFIAFWLLKKKLTPKPSQLLDLDWFYRRPELLSRNVFVEAPGRFFDFCENRVQALARRLVSLSRNPYDLLRPGKAREYSPDLYRSPSQILVMAVFAVFLLMVALGLFFSAG